MCLMLLGASRTGGVFGKLAWLVVSFMRGHVIFLGHMPLGNRPHLRCQ